MNTVYTCILAIMIPQGQICIKPDGNITYPQDAKIDQQSKAFWEELGKTYRLFKTDWCI